ncbi:Phosphoribosylformylglycinamidine synthase subunit PurQ [bioreactor metagenome]|uniref:Phosphoribosylformylglycinamidine synthase subunit PurQ n=1 Tax=bioreactor metagenome TaxID=1076179 RepID=A0A644ZUG4_9ZZZZ
MERAGAAADVLVLRTGSPEATKESLLEFSKRLDGAQALFLPGGFSNGDEPDGSGKYITAFLRSQRAADALVRLLDQRDGLLLGICNGCQALIKLGLLPTGSLAEPSPNSPTLTFNRIGRHQSGIVRTKIVSNRSPWLMLAETGGVYSVPVSHGEGRFLCPPDVLHALAARGQIAAQYVDEQGNPSMDICANPNGSDMAVEAITSPDGRILGKMGHSERIGNGLYKNIPGRFDLRLFESLVRYYS